MNQKKINFGFFISRTPQFPKKEIRHLINHIFPEEWSIFFLVRKPMFLTGYANNISPINIYADPVYKIPVTTTDIQAEEKWLGISFNSIIYMEDLRMGTFYSPSIKRKKNIVRHIRFFRKFFIDNNINFCFSSLPADITEIVFHHVVKKLNIPYVDMIRPYLLTNDEKRSILLKNYKILKLSPDESNSQEINNIDQHVYNTLVSRDKALHNEIKNESSKNLGFSFSTIRKKYIQFRMLIRERHNYESQYSLINLSLNYIKIFLNSKINQLLGCHIYSKPIVNEKYFYFPLHYKRDATISFKEPFIDQLHLIKIISSCLPHGIILYVKTHPHYVGSDFSIFELIKIYKLNNVKIIHYDYNNINLIKNSLGVITINSTTGAEAIALKKPVITLGNEFYAEEGISIIINNLNKLRSVFIDVIKNTNYNIDPLKRKKLIASYYKNSFVLNDYLFFMPGTNFNKSDFDKIKWALRNVAKRLI